MPRAAILFFGQPRVCTPHDYFMYSLDRFCATNKEYDFENYMHQWQAPSGQYQTSQWACNSLRSEESSLDYLLDVHTPVKHKFELQREFNVEEHIHPGTNLSGWQPYAISQMISQIHSLSEVCRLVDRPDDYQWFVAVRVDSELSDSVPRLATLDDSELHGFSDIIQIFGRNVLTVYQNLMSIIREVPSDGSLFNAEMLRRYPLQMAGITMRDTPGLAKILRRWDSEIRVEDHFNDNTDIAVVNPEGVYCRNLGDRILIKMSSQGGQIRYLPDKHDVEIVVGSKLPIIRTDLKRIHLNGKIIKVGPHGEIQLIIRLASRDETEVL